MKKYLVICQASITELQKSVDAHLALGWDLQGGIAISSKGVYYQAMSRG